MFRPAAARSNLCLALSFTAASALSLPSISNAEQSVPFKATFQTKETLGFNPVACPAPPYLQGTTTGTGIASHLGKVTVSLTDCVTPGESTFTFTGGRLVMTAANGDTVTADYSGSLTPTADYPTFALSGSYRVTGGTGRFKGATGSGYLQGTDNIASGAGSYAASGSISY